MITELTQSQIDRFPHYVNKWLTIGHSVGDCDVEATKRHIADAYKVAGLSPPEKFVLFDSPLSGAIGASILKNKLARDSVRASVVDSVGDSVRDSVWDSVGDSVWDSVGASVRDSVRDSVGASVWDSIYGSQDAGWLSFYDYFLTELDIDECKKLTPLFNLAKTCGWWIPYKNVCIIQHKPDYIRLDDRNLTHSETGMAVKYRDGFGFSAWHGTRIPDEWVTDKSSITPEIILRHENAEQRRCACEIVGWNEAIKLMDAKVIDRNDNAQIGTLLQVSIPEIGNEQFIKVECGTGRTFALPVPPDVKTAQEAQNWINFAPKGVDAIPQVRT